MACSGSGALGRLRDLPAWMAYWQEPDGTLLFGTAGGIVSVLPGTHGGLTVLPCRSLSVTPPA